MTFFLLLNTKEDILKNADNKPFREPKLFSYQISSFVFQGKVRNKMWVREWSQNINIWVNWLFKGFAVLMSNVAVFCMSQVNLKSGTNILYWRTTGMLLGGKPVKPVLLKNIQIEGVRFWSNHVYFCLAPFFMKNQDAVWTICVVIFYGHIKFFVCACFVCRCGVHLRVFSMQAGHLQ